MSLLTDFEQQSETLIKTLQVARELERKNTVWYEQLQAYDRKLKAAQADLFTREQAFAKEQLELSFQKNFLRENTVKLQARENSIQLREKSLDARKVDIEKQLIEQANREQTLDAKLREASSLISQQKAIRLEKTQIEHEKVIDRERKKQLDEREAFLAQETARLQNLAERMR